MVTIVLDEFTHHLADALSPFTTLAFHRSKSFSTPVETAVAQLLDLLTRPEHQPPFVLVSPSLGAFTALAFAHRHPELVSGLVLLDPSHPRQSEGALVILSEADSSPAVEELQNFFSGTHPTWESGCHAFAEVESLGDLPVAVLAGGSGKGLLEKLPLDWQRRMLQDRHAMLRDYARLSTRGTFRVVPEAGHGIAADAPKAVVEAIRELVSNVI